jgi:uncharacterized membrane protein YbhN (UPF0104 family)
MEPAIPVRPPHPRSRLKQVIAIGVGLAVVAATFLYVLPRIADYHDVWKVVERLSWGGVAALGGATLLNLATFPFPWMAVLPGFGFRRAFALTQASTASTYIAPGGAAIGVALSYAMLRAWGYGARAVGLAAALTGIWNQFAMLGFPAVAFALLTLQEESEPLLQTFALIGLVVFVVAAGGFAASLATPNLARLAGMLVIRSANAALRLIRRGPVGWRPESFVQFRDEAVVLLRRRWLWLTAATLAGQLTVFLLFLVSLRALDVTGGQVSVVEAFAAWSLPRLIGSLPITPGGIGVVEVGLTTALVGFGGPHAGVVAAVLLFRFLNIVPTLILGLVAGASWRRLQPAR